MRFADRTLLRLLDPGERAAIFTPATGAGLLAAAYSFDHVAVGEVTGASVRRVDPAPLVHPARRIAMTARETSTGRQWEAAADLPATPVVTGDAVVEVDVIASVRGVVSEVVEVATTALADLADVGLVDALVIAADGALPDDPAELDRRRYEELVRAIAARFPETPDGAIAAALRDRGITDFTGLFAALSPPHAVTRLALTVVTDGSVPASERRYRVTALVHALDGPDGDLGAALAAIATARAVLGAGADPVTPPEGMTPRAEFPAVLVVPSALLDDDDLPLPAGTPPPDAAARRAARLAELTTRLRDAAIVPVAV